MIIARSPLRISLGGGGTDLASYYRENGGFLLAAAIDKYVYVTVTKPFTSGIFLTSTFFVRMVAAKIGRVAFLDPDIDILPLNAFLPLIISFCIKEI